ncbi:MAG TPA: hypothetical protein VK447_15840, partial [Myxococcaceae bacterium]|nr:hypothetical protein [Myxococcaceae bacterium]
LALLPADQFDPLLRRLAREHGAIFPAPECQPLLEGDRLTVGNDMGQRLEGRVDELQRPRARRLLDAWGGRSNTDLAAAG